MDLTDEESVQVRFFFLFSSPLLPDRRTGIPSLQAAYEQVSELEFVKKDGIGMLVLNGGVNPGLEDTVSEMRVFLLPSTLPPPSFLSL